MSRCVIEERSETMPARALPPARPVAVCCGVIFLGVPPHRAAQEREDKRRRHVRAVLVAALVLAGALSIAGTVIGMLKTDLDDEFWLEIARAGVQVLAVVVIGGAVAAAWRYLEQERSDQQKRLADDREQQRQLHEQQLAVFRQIVESYNEVKAIRRTLRSIGLRAATGTMSETQVRGFRELMLRLNVVQLAFEALKRELGETDFFKEDTAEIVKRLYYIESHLNIVLQVWEKDGSAIQVGSDAGFVSLGLVGLIGPSKGLKEGFEHRNSRTTSFKEGVVTHRREITRLIHKHLFGPASGTTKAELDQLENDEDRNSDN
jgi:hypothetical protein